MTFTEIKIDLPGISYENHAACMVIEVEIKLKLVKFNKEKMVRSEACLLGFIVVSVYYSKNKGDTFDKRDVSSTY